MKQLILCADMEGASGIFDRNGSWLNHGNDTWRNHGRACVTSDALAICNAAIDYGIDDILLYDGHFAGNPEFNIILEQLPPIVRVFDVQDRCFDWRRIRGQAVQKPFGLITFGQHARYGTQNAYFPHTIQSPPIKSFTFNGLHVAEIGSAVLNFYDVPYLANIGCQASMSEAQEQSPHIVTIPVKDKVKQWEPSPEETYPLIYQGVTKALSQAGHTIPVSFEPPFLFSLELCDGYVFNTTTEISWKGTVTPGKAHWTAPSIEIGFEIFHCVRSLLIKVDR